MTFRALRLAVAAALLLLPAYSQTKQETDAFRLSMPKIQATITAYRNVLETVASDPALAKRLEAEEEKLEDTNGRDSLSMAVERLQTREPKLAAAYKTAGITPKEAGMTMETLAGVMLGEAMLDGSKSNAKLPEGFVGENMAFYRQHKAEVLEAFRQFEQLSDKAKALRKKSDGDKDDEKD